ncbi:acryloyl-CoA reductase [Cohnella lubricantis]|uniref:Acryloyl-CoA reductase n=1 Tax=Cohnella lubricantis TaxID=2163172 RepID=A0A841THC0_9BACL|nr:acryloyl-CoA reductase [Cohnella lubricantis]MBB6677851.1 acryloyl-CoA reductase [Cohnella lubricantis]MBP2119030.1 putative YhdH/YhfP family quinone oxidoreductase [Cohnella lubricantis]
MLQSFQALVVDKQEERLTVEVRQLSLQDLPAGELLVKVHYSGVNYKDSFAAMPNSPMVKSYPIVPGIDLAGVVVASEDSRFKEGDEIIATSYEIGITHYGGYAEYARIPAKWAVPLPAGLTMRESMIIGTAGFTAALSVQRLEENGLAPGKGKVLVTGATGGVGSFAIAILAQRGYEVEASSGKVSEHEYLRALGAASIVSRDEVSNVELRPLGKQRWVAAVDPVGGEPLAAVINQIQYGGSVAASGLTGGVNVPLTVFPFIGRGVNLLGIDSVYCPMEPRVRTWNRLAADFKPAEMERFVQREVKLEQLPEVLPTLLQGQARGRTIVCLA